MRVSVADCEITHTGARTCVSSAPVRFSLDGTWYEIQPGFEYNGASIPRAFWRVLYKPEDLRVLLPALIHDWLYRVQPRKVSRKDADGAFLALLGTTGVPTGKARVMWLAVRLFGWAPWWKYRLRMLYS